jgi:hypothetical protein
LSFSKTAGEHGKYRFGFKHKKCLFLHRSDLISISGNFTDGDKLNGRVLIEFKDGTALLGHAKDNRLVGNTFAYKLEPTKLVNISTINGMCAVLYMIEACMYIKLKTTYF